MKTLTYLTIARWMVILVLSGLLMPGCKKEMKSQDTPSLGEVRVMSSEMQPDIYFQQAINAFANKDYEESAKAIGQACDYMASIKGLSNEKFQTNLENSIAELRELATNVQADRVDGLEELNYFFARAGNALAGVHMHVTEGISFNVQGKEAGAELMKAIGAIRNMVNYHQYEFDAEEQTLLSEIEGMAKRLENHEQVTKEEMDAKFKLLASHLNKWGNDIEVSYSGSHKKGVIHNQF